MSAGPGSGGDCRAWRGELAARALGRADDAVDTAFDAHLDGCADCRAELAELLAAATAARRADPDRLHVPVPTPALADQIVARIGQEAGAARRRRTARVLGGVAAAAAAVIAVVVMLSVAGGDGRDGPRVELAGSEGADGTAVLAERSWGTEVTLEAHGLHDGEVYWLWLTDAEGDRVGAGTVRGTGRSLTAVFSSAMPTDDASRIWVTDEDDVTVLDARIDPG